MLKTGYSLPQLQQNNFALYRRTANNSKPHLNTCKCNQARSKKRLSWLCYSSRNIFPANTLGTTPLCTQGFCSYTDVLLQQLLCTLTITQASGSSQIYVCVRHVSILGHFLSYVPQFLPDLIAFQSFYPVRMFSLPQNYKKRQSLGCRFLSHKDTQTFLSTLQMERATAHFVLCYCTIVKQPLQPN